MGKSLNKNQRMLLIMEAADDLLTTITEYPNSQDENIGRLSGMRTAVHFAFGKESGAFIHVDAVLDTANRIRSEMWGVA
jgi:hypothetical protein